jgi:hypothetical protein
MDRGQRESATYINELRYAFAYVVGQPRQGHRDLCRGVIACAKLGQCQSSFNSAAVQPTVAPQEG